MIEAGAVPVAEHAAELAVAPVAEHAAGLAAGLADDGPAAEHVVALAAGFVVVVVVAAGAVPAAEQDDVLVAAGLAVELADGLAAGQLAELEPVGAVCCRSFLVG